MTLDIALVRETLSLLGALIGGLLIVLFLWLLFAFTEERQRKRRARTGR